MKNIFFVKDYKYSIDNLTKLVWECHLESNSWPRTQTQIYLSIEKLSHLNPFLCVANFRNKIIGVCISIDEFQINKFVKERVNHYFCELGVHPKYRRKGVAKKLIQLTEKKKSEIYKNFTADVRIGSNSHFLFKHLGYKIIQKNDKARCIKPKSI